MHTTIPVSEKIADTFKNASPYQQKDESNPSVADVEATFKKIDDLFKGEEIGIKRHEDLLKGYRENENRRIETMGWEAYAKELES